MILEMVSTCCWIVVISSSMTPELDEIVTAVEKRNASNETVDISWEVIRDSRSLDLAGKNTLQSNKEWRWRSDGQNCRMDGWLPIHSTENPRPTRSYADRARSQAKFLAHLQSGFRHPAQPFVFQEHAQCFSTEARLPKGWGELDHLLAVGATLSANPFSNKLLPLERKNLALRSYQPTTVAGDRLVVVREPLASDRYHEFWFTLPPELRLMRWLEVEQGEITRQLDFEYSDDDAIWPHKWTAQTFDPATRYHEFADAKRVAIQRNVRLDSSEMLPVEKYRHRHQASRRDAGEWPSLVLKGISSVSGMLVFVGLVFAISVFRTIRQSRLVNRSESTMASDAPLRKVQESEQDVSPVRETPHTPKSNNQLLETSKSFQSPVQDLRRKIASFFEAVRTCISLRGILLTVIVLACLMLLRGSPLTEPSVTSAYLEVERIWSEAEELRQRNVDSEAWQEFEKRSRDTLRSISNAMTQVQERSPGVGEMLWGRDESKVAARQDLIQLARNEIPANLALGTQEARQPGFRIEYWLDRLGDYTEGLAPYGLDRSLTSETRSNFEDNWISGLLIVCMLVTCGTVFLMSCRW